MANRGGEFSFFQGIGVRIDVRIDISTSIKRMIINFGKQVHLHDLTQTRLIKQVLVTLLRQDHVTNWKHLHYLSAYGHKTWQDGDLLWWTPAHKVTHDALITWTFEITWQTKIITFPLSECLWSVKLGRMVTYLDGLLSIKSHDPLMTWACKITWQTKVISPQT